MSNTKPVLPELPASVISVLKYDTHHAIAVHEWGKAMYKYGRKQMREECLDVIDEVSDISLKQDAELTRAIKELP